MYSFVINICSLSFELLPPHGSGRNYCQSLDQATATGRCSTFHMIAILHGHYILHAFASKRTVVCTRTIYLPPTLTSQFLTLTWLSQKHCFIGRRCYTVPCKSHRGQCYFSFLSVQSERVEHAQVLARAKRAHNYNGCILLSNCGEIFLQWNVQL